jgi:hypothetical protein
MQISLYPTLLELISRISPGFKTSSHVLPKQLGENPRLSP